MEDRKLSAILQVMENPRSLEMHVIICYHVLKCLLLYKPQLINVNLETGLLITYSCSTILKCIQTQEKKCNILQLTNL